MPRTRSSKNASPQDAEQSASGTAQRVTLAPEAAHPSTMFILPKRATPGARIVTLPHPRHSRPSRYLVCPETGVYEFTKTSAPKSTPRSWLIEPQSKAPESAQQEDGSKAQVSAGAELYIATALDPLFLLLPALVDLQSAKQSEDRKRLFLSSDDYFDKLPEESSHLSEVLQCAKTRALFEARMAAICDVVEAGDESMFRINNTKLLSAVLNKAKALGKGGLPPSMESKFVSKPLEAPIAVRQMASVITETQSVEEPVNEVSTPQTETTETQSTATSSDSVATGASEASTTVTSITEVSAEVNTMIRMIEPTADIIELQRIRVAFDYICSAYIATPIATQLRNELSNADSELIDFSPLTDYITKVNTLRAEAYAERPTDFNQRKRGREEEEDEQLEKKRKLEEEKKKKAKESKSIKDLKKVDTSGMKKLSHFFKKK